MLEVGSGSKFQLLPHFHIIRPSSGSTKEFGSASQGPSLVDYSLELEVDFPTDMVLEMQVNAAKKSV
jgi:hypothetical protein